MNHSMREVFDIARHARQVLEHVWSLDTAHHSVVHGPDTPLSRGQCGVSSVWLARQMIERGYDAQVAEGILGLDELNEGFVWVHLERPAQSPWIVDITSDQFGSINSTSVHVGEYGSGPGRIGAYTLQECFDPYANVHRKLMRRYALLEQKLNALPWWRQKILSL